MPARSVRLTLVFRSGDRPPSVLRFPAWWDRGAFFERFKEREIDAGNPVDWNLAWLLSAAEAAAWDKRCWTDFASDPLASDPRLLEDRQKLEALLKEAAWVIVESTEWESGRA